MVVVLVCEKKHQIIEKVVCPDCGEPLTWASRTSDKENVAVCWKCWGGRGRNWIIRDIITPLGLKKCPECGATQFFFVKKA